MMLSWRKRGPRALVIAGTVFLGLAAAVAVARAQSPKGRVSLTGEVGGCLPRLGDVNKGIRLGNDALKSYGWDPMDEISMGATFTGDLRARVYGPITVSAGIGHSFAKTTLDFDEVISVKPKLDFYHVRVFYDLPVKPMPRMFLRVGAGPVFARKAEVQVRHERRRVEGGTQWIEYANFKGKGTGAHALLEAEMMLNVKTTLVFDLGYRYINLTRDGSTADYRDWGRYGVERAPADDDGDGIPNGYDLADPTTGQGYVGAAFVEVVHDPSGRPIPVDATGRPLVHARGMDKIDFSGVQGSVGLRFYLF